MFGLWPLTPTAEWKLETRGHNLLSFQILYIFNRKELPVVFIPQQIAQGCKFSTSCLEKKTPKF